MPRPAYQDRRKYDGEEDSHRQRDRYRYEDERDRNGGSSSSSKRESNHSNARREYSSRGRDNDDIRRGDRREIADRSELSSSHLHSSAAVGRGKESRRRSRSPDFERDRAREREAYGRRYGDRREGAAEIQGRNEEPSPSDEPVFEASGLLAKESNNKNGVALKYAEPPEARKSKKKWRLYVFKDGKEIDVLHISRQSCYLIGRDRAVADIPIDHPSISKQHAAIQFRNIRERNEYGDEKSTVKPFLIDLDSANGCLVNDTEVPPSRYYEMRNGDTLKLGGSQREYVLLAED